MPDDAELSDEELDEVAGGIGFGINLWKGY
jgi:hypothetical protein